MPNLVWEATPSWRELLRKIPPGEMRGNRGMKSAGEGQQYEREMGGQKGFWGRGV